MLGKTFVRDTHDEMAPPVYVAKDPDYNFDDWSFENTIEGLRGIDKASLHAEMHKRQREMNVIFWEKFVSGWKIKNKKHSAQQVSFNSSDFDKFRSTSFTFADEEKQRINEVRMSDEGRKKRKYLRISGDEGKLEI